MINLFKNTAEVKAFYQMLSKNTDFAEIDNSLQQVTTLFVAPFVGNALLLDLSTTTETTKINVINLLKTAVVNYFVFQELPNRTYFFSSSGAKQSDNEKTNNLSDSNIKFRQNHAIKQADAFLDIALNEIVNAPSVFPNFAPIYKMGSQFFTTAQDLTEIINVQGLRAFISISRYLRQVEQNELTNICGSTFLTNIKANSDPRAQTAVKLIRYFVANQALFLAIPNLLFAAEGDGLKLYSSSDGFDRREHILKEQSENLKVFRQSSETNANTAKRHLLSYLKTNQTFFTDYNTYITAQTPEGTTAPATIQNGTGAVIF